MKSENGLKRCPQCKKHKSTDDFHKSSREIDGLACYCKTCASLYRKAAYQKEDKKAISIKRKVYREENKDKIRNRLMLRKYNMTLEIYNKILHQQENRCALCKRDFIRRPYIDHDHSCCPDRKRSCGNCVRGLLCSECNLGLGLFKDSIETFKNAVNYLQTKH